jgi:hypothetical protein
MQLVPVFPQISDRAFRKDAGTTISEVVLEDKLARGDPDARCDLIFFRDTLAGLTKKGKTTTSNGWSFNLSIGAEISLSNLIEISILNEGDKTGC